MNPVSLGRMYLLLLQQMQKEQKVHKDDLAWGKEMGKVLV